MSRRVVWFSCGAASAVAAKRAVDKYGVECEVVYCDTLSTEHPDNRRFFTDVERWIGRSITLIKSAKYASIDDVFQRRRYMAGIKGAICTTEMKKFPREAWQRYDDRHIFGYTAEERRRAASFEAQNPTLYVEWLLIDEGITKAACLAALTNAGIALPAMYTLGFDHNNCLGCVKATSPGYWNRTRREFGSCPCQPFSVAGRGRGRGFADARHLWPEWFRLIRECRPPVVFGEQVASPAGLGWFDAVRADLEGAGYAVGVADLCAAGVGAPHIRQRLYFVAVADLQSRDVHAAQRQPGRGVLDAARSGAVGKLVDAGRARGGRDPGAVPRTQGEGARERRAARGVADVADLAGAARGMAGADEPDRLDGGELRGRRLVQPAAHPTAGFWADADWIACRDGKARPVEPGTSPLAHGAAARMGRLRAYGNAIVPQVAAAFIASVMESISCAEGVTVPRG